MLRRPLLMTTFACLTVAASVCGALALRSNRTASAAMLVEDVLDVGPFQDVVREIVLHELKDRYEDRHHWGQKTQVKRFAVRGKWFEPRLDKHIEEVNDGLWQRFVVTLIEPEKNLQLRLGQAHATGNGQTAFSFTLEAKMSGEAHIERWRKGIKMLNTSALFDASIAARIDCELGIRREPGILVDDVLLDPQVTAIDLQLLDFDLKKVGILGRDVARELSNSLKPIVEHELKRREPKIVVKANAAIDKRRDRLRFSLTKFLASGWSQVESSLTGGKPAK